MTPTTNIPAWAQSSADATQVSLTITSISKMVGAVLVTFATLKGLDPILVTTNVTNVTEAAQNIVVQYIAILPALYAAYQSVKVVEGIGRKVWFRLFPSATPTL